MIKKTYKPSAVKAKKSSTTSNGGPKDKKAKKSSTASTGYHKDKKPSTTSNGGPKDNKAKKPIKYSSYLAGKLARTSKYTSGGAIHPKYTKLKSEYEKAKNLEKTAKARKKK